MNDDNVEDWSPMIETRVDKSHSRSSDWLSPIGSTWTRPSKSNGVAQASAKRVQLAHKLIKGNLQSIRDEWNHLLTSEKRLA